MNILKQSEGKILRNAAGKVLVADPFRGAFVFTVNVGPGITVTLPFLTGYTYACLVSWGDNTQDSMIAAYNSPNATHTYTTAGTYTIKIGGKCQAFAVNDGAFKTYVTSVVSWGYCDFRTLNFWGCLNLTTLPTGAITGCNNITTMAYFICSCTSYTSPLNDQWFTQTPLVTDFTYALANVRSTADIPVDIFRLCPAVTTFANCFTSDIVMGSSGTQTIPEYLFWYNPEVLSFNGTFGYMYAIKHALSNKLFYNNTKVKDFGATFNECQNIEDYWVEDMFWNNPEVTSFGATFQKLYKVKGNLPKRIFWYNTKVTSFGYCFAFGGYVGSNCGTLDPDTFMYNTEVTSFEWTWRWNYGVTTIPNGLFRNCKKATNFYLTFYRCNNAIFGQYPFSGIDPAIPGDTEIAAAYRRFTGKSVAFNQCFYEDGGATGSRYAPELWDPAIYNRVSMSSDRCFQVGNAAYHPYTNEASIPVGWK